MRVGLTLLLCVRNAQNAYEMGFTTRVRGWIGNDSRMHTAIFAVCNKPRTNSSANNKDMLTLVQSVGALT
ncbi:MAG: hypothetical protein CMB79_21845 [Filomicrobium sp.]|nr:hypothetical protein [Filomicrobium sp.]